MQHVEIITGSVLECIYIVLLVHHVADIKYIIQNDAIMLESVVEYCNRVNSLLFVIKFNAACWNQYLEYSGIYIALLVHHVADIKYDTEWCDYAWECCRIL